MLGIVRTRLLQLIVVLWVLSIVTFSLMKLAPGDPVLTLLRADEMSVTQADEAALRSLASTGLCTSSTWNGWAVCCGWISGNR